MSIESDLRAKIIVFGIADLCLDVFFSLDPDYVGDVTFFLKENILWMY